MPGTARHQIMLHKTNIHMCFKTSLSYHGFAVAISHVLGAIYPGGISHIVLFGYCMHTVCLQVNKVGGGCNKSTKQHVFLEKA